MMESGGRGHRPLDDAPRAAYRSRSRSHGSCRVGERELPVSEKAGVEWQRLATIALCIGAIAVVLAASPYKLFELDRYFVPKELALHLTALVTALLCLASARRLALTGVDVLLLLFLVLSVASALGAENGWAATRSLAISLSGITLFWIARHLARIGFGRVIVIAVLVAVTIAAITSLAQAYGVETATSA